MVFQLQPGAIQSSVFLGKRTPQARGKLVYTERSSHLWSLRGLNRAALNAAVLLVEIGLQAVLQKAWPRWQKHCAGRPFSSTEASPQSAVCVRDPCAEMAAKFCLFVCLFNLSPVSHQEPFLVGAPCRVHNRIYVCILFCFSGLSTMKFPSAKNNLALHQLN